MKKIKYLLLIMVSIFCLNSCYFLVSYCSDGHICPSWLTGDMKPSKKSQVGILYQKTSIEEDKNYYSSILSRPKKYIELEGVKILLPEGMSFKKKKKDIETNGHKLEEFGMLTDFVEYYLYDKKKNIGFPLGITKKDRKSFIASTISGKFNKDDSYVKEISNNVYQETIIYPETDMFDNIIPASTRKNTSYVKKINNSDFYVTYEINNSGSNEMQEFFFELVKDW